MPSIALRRWMIAFMICAAMTAFAQSPGKAARPPMRIAVATISHETCTFCPQPTDIAECEFYGPPMRGNDVLAVGGYARGFVDAAREYEGVELIGVYSPRDAKGGSSGSWVTREAFDKYTNGMAGTILEVAAPGLGPAALSGLPHQNIPKDLYPLGKQ
jgi:microcystin degradation protein MlrC